MVEEVEAVGNLNEIVSVQGVDIVHIALSDLGQSMGNAPQKEVRELMDEVVPQIRVVGKWAGVGGTPQGMNPEFQSWSILEQTL